MSKFHDDIVKIFLNMHISICWINNEYPNRFPTRLRYCVSSCFKYLSCSSKVLAT